MFRYYLIPFETDPAKKIPGCTAQPKYINLFGKASSLQPKPVEREGHIVTKYKQNYYIVRMDKELPEDFDEIEKMPDVIRLDASTEISKLISAGIGTTGLIDISPREEKDRAVTKWLTGEERVLSEVLLGIR